MLEYDPFEFEKRLLRPHIYEEFAGPAEEVAQQNLETVSAFTKSVQALCTDIEYEGPGEFKIIVRRGALERSYLEPIQLRSKTGGHPADQYTSPAWKDSAAALRFVSSEVVKPKGLPRRKYTVSSFVFEHKQAIHLQHHYARIRRGRKDINMYDRPRCLSPAAVELLFDGLIIAVQNHDRWQIGEIDFDRRLTR